MKKAIDSYHFLRFVKTDGPAAVDAAPGHRSGSSPVFSCSLPNELVLDNAGASWELELHFLIWQGLSDCT